MNKLAQKWSAASIPDDDEAAERRARAEADPLFFCEYYLPHYFPTPLAPWQRQVIGDVETALGPNPHEAYAYAAPRGHGKTTFISFALTLRDLVRGASKFTLYIGPTQTAARDRIAEIRMELQENERLRNDYGDLLASSSRHRLAARADSLELSNGARIAARGACQSMRGVKHRQYRPDRVILDDIDKDQEAANPGAVEKRIKWFNRVVRGLRGANPMIIVAVGNIIGRNTFLTHCLSHKNFRARIYRAIQDDGTPLMPALFTLPQLQQMREDVGNDAFETEYQNNPPSEGARLFRTEWMGRRWSHADLDVLDNNGKPVVDPGIIVAIDLSAAKNERSDFQGIIAIQRDTRGRIYIRKADINRRSRRELARRIFSFCQALGLDRVVSVVIEANGFQEWCAQEIAEVAAAEGIDLPIRTVTHTVAKYDRIAKLSPIAEGHRLLFPPEDEEEENIKLLRRQMEMYPDDKHDDGPDVLAMAVEESARRRRDSSARSLPISPFDRQHVPQRGHS